MNENQTQTPTPRGVPGWLVALLAAGAVLIGLQLFAPRHVDQVALEQAAGLRQAEQAELANAVANVTNAQAKQADAEANLTDAQARRSLVQVQVIEAQTNQQGVSALVDTLKTQSDVTAGIIESQQQQNERLANQLAVEQANNAGAQAFTSAAEARKWQAIAAIAPWLALIAAVVVVLLIVLVREWRKWQASLLIQQPAVTIAPPAPRIKIVRTNAAGYFYQIEGSTHTYFRSSTLPVPTAAELAQLTAPKD